MSANGPDELPDESGLEDQPPSGCYLYTAVIGIETPEGECTTDPSTDLEIEFPHFPTEDERAAAVLDEGGAWLSFYLTFSYFTDRFGPNPPLCIVADTIQQC